MKDPVINQAAFRRIARESWASLIFPSSKVGMEYSGNETDRGCPF